MFVNNLCCSTGVNATANMMVSHATAILRMNNIASQIDAVHELRAYTAKSVYSSEYNLTFCAPIRDQYNFLSKLYAKKFTAVSITI